VLPKAPGADCANCPAQHMRFVPPEPSTNGSPKLTIVGEGPGYTELEQGRPFIGPSGRMLDRGLRSLEVERAQTHITNAVLCGPLRDKELAQARKACQGRLTAELAQAAAPITIPLGGVATHGVLLPKKKPSILKWRGSVTPHGNTLVLPTVHPALVLRQLQWAPILEHDFARIKRVMRDGFTPPEELNGRRILVAKDFKELIDFIGELQGTHIGFDVETVGLGAMQTKLVCFGLSDATTTVVIPWSTANNGQHSWWLQPARIAELITHFFKGKHVVTHNGPAFDHVVAQRYGIFIDRWDDTLHLAHVTNSHLPKRLSHVVTTHGVDAVAWKELEDRTADLDRLFIYNGRDALYMMLAWRVMRRMYLQ
jgi:uracil-DNA glycosylase family 4